MARIRTIKPDFWTDEKIVELSAFARLLFIGLWNFADDEGRMVFSPKKIKMQIFPADTLDISELFGEIRRESLIEIYVVDGVEYLQVKNFYKHQKIDKRTASRLPENSIVPPNPPKSPRIPTTEGKRNGMEKEGKGKDKTSYSDEDMSFAIFFFQELKKINPSHKEPNLQSWAKESRLMRERDNRSISDAEKLTRWVFSDSFWKSNILSVSKLREKWDALTIKMNQVRSGSYESEKDRKRRETYEKLTGRKTIHGTAERVEDSGTTI